MIKALQFVVSSLTLWLILALEGVVGAQERHALIIGNQTYSFSPLDNPISDARAIASVLGQAGFTVDVVEDADLASFAVAIHRLRAEIEPGDTALFYYAGHGVQFGQANYLLPIDVQVGDPGALPAQSIAAADVLRIMTEARPGITIMILDACRENPFPEFQDSFADGLATLEPSTTEGLIAFATAPGGVAVDGDGANSPFTSALVSTLVLPGLEIFDVFREVRARVRRATNALQIPTVNASLEQRFYFRPKSSVSLPPTTAGMPTLASVLWREISDSKDPSDFAAYLRLFPGGEHRQEAARLRGDLLATGARPRPITFGSQNTLGVPNGIGSLITACDQVSADDQDPMRIAAPVRFSLINTPLAIRTCTEALAEDPENPRLVFQLARSLDAAQRYYEAWHFYTKAAKAGYGAALSSLAYMYLTQRGVPPDEQVSAELYRRAALGGNLRAMVGIARAYRNGWGVPQSDAEARQWLELAASHSWPAALDNLALHYRKGLGVETDHQRAFELYSKAAEFGHTAAMDNLGTMYALGEFVGRDYARANAWYRRASDLGNRHGAFHLALHYLLGRGVEPDPMRAFELFELAASRGYPLAHTEIGMMFAEGTGVQRDLEEAFFRYLIASRMGNDKAERLLSNLAPHLSAEQTQRLQSRADDWLRENADDQSDPPRDTVLGFG
jgi:TPR repeat protein